MEIKEINKIIQSDDKDEEARNVKCICISYGDFLADYEGFMQKRYHDFKCNPKHQFEKKADTILENVIHEKNFMPGLFLIHLNRKQSTCNNQIDFIFELLDKSFPETDPIRKNEISEETLNLCLSADVSSVMVCIGVNRQDKFCLHDGRNGRRSKCGRGSRFTEQGLSLFC